MTRRIVLATVGSLGDLHPFIALGQALQRLGFEVRLASAAEYRDKVEAAGLSFRPVRPGFGDMEQDLGQSRAAVTRAMIADARFLFRRLVLPYLRQSYDDMLAICTGADLVVTSSLAYGGRLAAEKLSLPCLGIVLQPMMFLSAYDPPTAPHAEWLTGLMRALGPGPSRTMLLLVRRALRGMFAPLADLRRELGLAPLPADPLFDGQFSAAGAIGLYSPLLGGVQPDYPAHSIIAGFAPFDSFDGREPTLGEALEAFLRAGAPPLVFTLGSLIVNDPGSFYRESVAAARQLGMRAVLLVGDSATAVSAATADDRDPDVFACAYAPHSLLFPRAAAVVHHGGIGSLAQAMRSGRPELIVPFFADQVDNAARARRLGIALVLAPGRYRVAPAASLLVRLLQDPTYQAAAALVKARLDGEDGPGRAAAFIRARLDALSGAAAPAGVLPFGAA